MAAAASAARAAGSTQGAGFSAASTAYPSRWAISASRSATSESVRRRKSKRWQRERIVAGILCRSVVARMKTACEGGSSSVFSSAWKAAAEMA